MLEFPPMPSHAEMPVRRMSLREYAHFSEHCLRSNPAITSDNCLVKNTSEKSMPIPFSLGARVKPKNNE